MRHFFTTRPFSSTPAAKKLPFLVPAFLLLYIAACGGGNQPVGPRTLTSIAVTAAASSIGVSAKDVFTASGAYSDNSSQVLTNVTWTSSNPAAATISTSGIATAVALGVSKITAQSGSITSPPFSLTVAPPTLESIVIYGDGPSVKVGGLNSFYAIGYYTDNSEVSPLTGVSWASSSTAVATIDSTGLATGIAAGATNITGTSGSVSSPPTLLTVPSIASIAILPSPAILTPGQLQQFIAIGTYSDGSLGDITGCSNWTSSNSATATIDSVGLATGEAAGTTSITATSGAIKSPQVLLTVSVTKLPPPSELLYAAANNAILGFTVDPASGTLSAPTYTPGPGLPCGGRASPYLGIVSVPSRGLLYASDSEDNELGGSTYGNIVFNQQVDGFAFSKSTSTLSTLSDSPFPVPTPPGWPYGATPYGMAVDPEGKFLYVSNLGDIDEFAIDATTGVLTLTPSSHVQAGHVGNYLTIDPSGRFLYTGSIYSAMSGFALEANTGTLTELNGSPFPLPEFNYSGEVLGASIVDSSGTFLYVVVDDPQEGGEPDYTYIAGYSIDATTGALTLVAGTPPDFGITNNTGLSGGIATVGNFLYVNNPQGIYGFSIAAGTGVLTQVSGSPFPAGAKSNGLVASADGKFLYEADSTQIYVFAITPSTGALSAVGDPVPAPGGPFLLTFYNSP